MSKKPRFPIPRYPRGWFQVAYADEIQPGEVQPLKYFGVELVMFRTEDGEVNVLDAFCPHMGAHLGHGGKVDGDGIVCPFHAWKFNGEGKCTEVPYAKHLPRKANITAWPVIERNGLIMVWHDIDGKEPEWDIPEFPNGTTRPGRRTGDSVGRCARTTRTCARTSSTRPTSATSTE